MKYVSIDIETGGLDRKCSLLEFGAFVDDLEKPFNPFPSEFFHTYILNTLIVGEPYALALHNKILKKIDKREPGSSYMNKIELGIHFKKFLIKNGFPVVNNFVEITVAGKNFAMFDKDWLSDVFTPAGIKVNHRVGDPAMYFLKPSDKKIPDTKTCMERAKLDGEVQHTALEDAIVVSKLLRKGLNLEMEI